MVRTTTQREYDTHNRLIKETLDTGLSLSYAYDLHDRLLSVTLPDQSGVQYVYNAHYLTTINRIRNNELAYSHQYTAYDQAENVLQMQLPFQAGRINYSYDLLGRSISIDALHWQESVPSNGYDAASNLLQRQVSDAQGVINYSYTYDDLYQLTSETGEETITYANDSLYNRIAKNNQPYAINAFNQLLQQTDCSYSYDVNGNLLAITQGANTVNYSYDALDRLIAIQDGDIATTYYYDSFHRRLSKTCNGITY